MNNHVYNHDLKHALTVVSVTDKMQVNNFVVLTNNSMFIFAKHREPVLNIALSV